MIQLYHNNGDCCGCTACMNICPSSAITMKENKEGFKYPFIDSSKCVECGLCKKVCSFQNGYDTSKNLKEPFVYAAKHKNESVRKSSTSGGAFTAISDYVIENSGVVYGVAFDESFNVVHKKAQTTKERNLFKGSKYVQSDLGNTYSDVLSDLKCGKLVLFVGTPCQCGGLRSYLNIKEVDQTNLIIIDIICHGTPSPLIWKEHVDFIQKKSRKRIRDYYFRPKINGWHNHTEMIIYNNDKKDYKSILSQTHKKLFYANLTLREACYNCKYTNLNRCSDITIADFWGIQNHMPDFDDDKGISLLLINTEKGREIYDEIKPILDVRESNTKDCIQPQLVQPSPKPLNRDEFWEDYFKYGYRYIIKKYANCSLSFYIKSNVKKLLKKIHLLNVLVEIKRKIK